MANRENRVKKLEEKTPTGRWIYPLGYYYGEPNSEPYWTDDPVKPFSAWYDDLEKEEAGERAYRQIDKPDCYPK